MGCSNKYTDDELLFQWWELYVELGRDPRIADIKKAHKKNLCACYCTLRKRLGTKKKIKAMLGFKPERKKKYLRMQLKGNLKEKKAILIKEYKALAKKLGRVPTYEDVTIAHRKGKCHCARTFYRVFKSFNNLALAIRRKPNIGGRKS